MGLIVKQLEIVGNAGRTTAEVLFDSGASESFIRQSVAEQIGTIARLPTPRAYTLGDGQGTLAVDECVQADIHLAGANIFETLFVADTLGMDVVLGADAFQRWKITLDCEQEDAVVDPAAMRLSLM